jgi:nucleoside-diphosphate-sugar epimerase
VLAAAGWAVEPFDLTDGRDLRNEAAVRRAMRGCEAVVHAGAIAHDSAGTPAEIVATNLLGTWHVLQAAESCSVSRVVYFSSAQVFGFAEGEGSPAYLPVDDAHPVRAARPYGMSKRLAEEMCAAWTLRTGIPTIVLRPVMILTDAALQRVTESGAELGAFVHAGDVATAVLRALCFRPDGHLRLTLCGPGPFDTSAARQVLGWAPSRGWPSRGLSG